MTSRCVPRGRPHAAPRVAALALAVLAARAAAAEAPAGAAAAAAAGEPVRVATLVTFVGDALAPMPERAIVVASVRRSMTEPAPAGVIDLGSPHGPSLEQLAAARPDVVVADELMHSAKVDELGRFAPQVVLVDSTSIDSTFASLRDVGRRVGAEAAMEEQVRAAEAALDGLALERPVATLPLFGAPASFLAVTDRTWLGDLLRRLNFDNLAAKSVGRERVPGYAEISEETLVALRPSLVVIVAHGDRERVRAAFVERLDQGAWHGLRDSATAGIHVLDPGVFNANPGLAMPEAARHLRGLASPALAGP